MRKTTRFLAAAAAATMTAAFASGETVAVYDAPSAQGLGFGQTDLASFGGWTTTTPTFGGNSYAVINAGATNPGPFSAGLIAMAVSNSDAAIQTVNGGGNLQAGNVIRLSAWVAADPTNPIVSSPLQADILKMEFWSVALSSDRDNDLAYDTEAIGGLFTEIGVDTLMSDDWTQYVFEYEVSALDFDPALIQEIRPVVIVGDFSGADPVPATGAAAVDRIIIEVFADTTAAAGSPVDSTNPGQLGPAAQTLHCDADLTTEGLDTFNKTDVFAFGPDWALTADASFEDNNFAAFTAFPAGDFAGCGFSVPISRATVDAAVGGTLADGNIIRVSGWFGSDPNNPFMNLDSLAVSAMKLEFWDTAFSLDRFADLVADTEEDTGTFEEVTGLTTSGWTQFVFEYTVNGVDVFIPDVAEVRAVALFADFSGTIPAGIEGTFFADGFKVEAFVDQAAADASPVDTTNPGAYPVLDCPCDYNDSGDTDVVDLLDFLSCWFDASAGNCSP